MERAVWPTLMWMGLLCLCAIGLTIASFYAFVLPESRGLTFVSVIVTSGLAEAALFAYLGYFLTVPHTVKRPSPAVRARILFLVALWTVLVLASGAVAVHPSQADTFYSDKVILLQSILTFFLLVGAYLFHRQDIVIQARDDAPQRQRIHLQAYAVGIDELLDSLRPLAETHPLHAGELDRLAKRLDTLKSQLLSVSPVAQREPERLVEPLSTEEIEFGLRELHENVHQLAQVGAERFGDHAARVRGKVDALVSLLRRRENVTAF